VNTFALPDPDEHTIQRMLVDYLRVVQVDAVWFAVPNGASWSPATARRLKREGALSGVADLIFIGPGGRAYCLEMKTRKGRQQPEQALFEHKVREIGGAYAIARSFDEALAVLRGWGLIA
jgi:hypothetical protein